MDVKERAKETTRIITENYRNSVRDILKIEFPDMDTIAIGKLVTKLTIPFSLSFSQFIDALLQEVYKTAEETDDGIKWYI